MTEYMHLVGAEDVQRASHAMKDAASEMQRAASNIEDSLFRHRQSMDEWLVRFDAAMNSVQAGHIERVRAEAALEEAKARIGALHSREEVFRESMAFLSGA